MSISKYCKQICDENLLRQKFSKEEKNHLAKKLVKKIKEKMQSFNDKVEEFKGTSITNIPFFDIDYRTMLRVMMKVLDPKEKLEIPSNKELHIIHQNIHLFERFFGFKFFDNHSIRLINNQSHVTLDRIYPEITDIIDEDTSNLLTEEQLQPAPTISSFHRQKLLRNKDFRILSEPSNVINNSQSFLVI